MVNQYFPFIYLSQKICPLNLKFPFVQAKPVFFYFAVIHVTPSPL